MKPAPGLRSKSLVIALALVLAALGATLAWAKPKPFVPAAGTYSGSSKSLGQSLETKGGVHIHSGNVSLNLTARAVLSCADGSTVPLQQAFTMKPNGKTFGIKASGAGEGLAAGFYHYEIAGKFTSKSAFSGTLSVKGSSEAAGSCSGSSQFSLTKG